jgi:hypothetical protein
MFRRAVVGKFCKSSRRLATHRPGCSVGIAAPQFVYSNIGYRVQDLSGHVLLTVRGSNATKQTKVTIQGVGSIALMKKGLKPNDLHA